MSVNSESISYSAKLRQEGNAFYKSAFQEGLSPVLKKTRLEKAMAQYMKALSNANRNYDDASSAAKNYAKCGAHIISLLKDRYQENSKELLYYYQETYQFFNKAIEYGQYCKSDEWRADVMSSFRLSFEELTSFCMELPRKERIIIFESAARGMGKQHYYGDCYFEICSIWLKEAITALSAKDYKCSLYALKEMYQPIEIMKQCGEIRPDLKEEAVIFEADMVIQMARTESLQAIHIANTTLQNHLAESEEIDMDCIYTVIDTYRHAMILTREVEIEVEAIALSHLGELYDSVLKLKSRASECLKKSIQLAHSLLPRVLTTEPWYKTASEILKRYQEETIQFQEKKREEERQKYLKEIESELKIIKERGGLNDAEFLFHVIENIPPKRKFSLPSKEKVLQMSQGDLKKIFQKAVVVYHPDKQDVEEYGMKWKVLCAEITKVFTNIYEAYKGFNL